MKTYCEACRELLDPATPEQNDKLQAMCRDVSRQVIWHGQKLHMDDWRHMFVAALHQQKAVPGIVGGFVVLAASSRRLTKAQKSDVIELIYSFGAEHDVIWSEPDRWGHNEHREVA